MPESPPEFAVAAADSAFALQYTTLRLEQQHEHVLIVRLDRPRAANAIDTRMGHELRAVFDALAAAPTRYRCAVLAASGNGAFCAGGDLKERNGMTDEAWQRQHLVYERMLQSIVDCPVPLIAAVGGAAYGGGCEIALACDFIYASEKARFALTEVTLGIMPGSAGTQTLPRALGTRRAIELLLTGRPFSASEAHEWGLVNEICAPAALEERVLQTAAQIASNAPLAVRQIKNSVRFGTQMDLRSAMQFEIEAYNRLVPTQDRLEGVRAFNEKRAPRFQGR